MNIIFDKITTETLAELEKTQKEFWNIPRKTGVLINMFIKGMFFGNTSNLNFAYISNRIVVDCLY